MRFLKSASAGDDYATSVRPGSAIARAVRIGPGTPGLYLRKTAGEAFCIAKYEFEPATHILSILPLGLVESTHSEV
jgi:hypothetical protein